MSLEVDDWDFCQDIEELIKYLQKYTEDKESSIRISAVLGIMLVAAAESEYYDRLLTYLKSLVINDDLYVRGSAALSIGLLGATRSDDPIPLLDMLKLLLFDETRFVRRNASVGLAFISSSIESKSKRQNLIVELLTSAYWYFRIGGALGMGLFCDQSDFINAIRQLKPMLNDSDVDVRIAAVYSLGFIAKRYARGADLIAGFKSSLYDYDAAVVLSARVVLNLLKIM
jgi:HEAT repeat protein